MREPEYTPQDQALLVADWYEQHEPKNAYGIPLSEATDPENAQGFVVPYPRRDYAAQAATRAQKQYEKDYPHDDPSSLLWRVDRAEKRASNERTPRTTKKGGARWSIAQSR